LSACFANFSQNAVLPKIEQEVPVEIERKVSVKLETPVPVQTEKQTYVKTEQGADVETKHKIYLKEEQDIRGFSQEHFDLVSSSSPTAANFGS
jgi:hypothetical protein